MYFPSKKDFKSIEKNIQKKNTKYETMFHQNVFQILVFKKTSILERTQNTPEVCVQGKDHRK